MTVFLQAISDRKEERLRALTYAFRSSQDTVDGIYELEIASFEKVPGAPFAYWVSESVLRLFEKLGTLSDVGFDVSFGASTKDDFRFVRTWWEVGDRENRWRWFQKGGEYSPFYGDVHLTVLWGDHPRELEASVIGKYEYLRGDAEWILHLSSPYLVPGIVWTRKTSSDFSPRFMPPGCIFSDQGLAAVSRTADVRQTALVLGLLSSMPYRALLALQMKAIGGAARAYEIGAVSSTPLPDEGEVPAARVSSLALKAWRLCHWEHSVRLTAIHFRVPALGAASGSSLKARLEGLGHTKRSVLTGLGEVQEEIDALAFEAYGGLGREEFGLADQPSEAERRSAGLTPKEMRDSVAQLTEWTVGVSFGRFDIRLATGERPIPEDPDPFDPLPVCSPGMLQDEDGLPATESPRGYPVDVAWDGILVDDEGHPHDIVRSIRNVFHLVSDGHDWATEAEDILGRDLRSWLRRSLFEDHVKRYSKSRRKAPIFWRLGTPSGSYSVWLYYPRATGDTLYRVLNDYVEPKLRHEESALLRLRQEAGDSPTASQQKRIEAQEELVAEVQDMKAELEVVVQLWTPEFDDGVVLNFAPFWRLVAHTRKWQKECKKQWDRLVKGEYDWSYTAMRLWPERVVPACAEDRSVAIAHGLEAEFFPEDEEGEKAEVPRVRESDCIKRLVEERTSQAVNQALETLLSR